MGHSTSIRSGLRNARGPGFLVRRLQQVSLSIFHEHLQSLDITPLQMTVLLMLQVEDGLEQVAVAARARVDTSTLKDVVNRLEAKALLKREPGLEDRRTRRLFLTPDGRALLALAQPQARHASEVLLAPLAAAERKRFLEMMERVVTAHEDKQLASPDAPWKRSRPAAE
jgi:DNA-binding MarR family transcriptional regulator